MTETMPKRYGLSASEVVDRFMEGERAGTGAAQVPGGRRVESLPEPHRRGTALYSYRTIVAVREEGPVTMQTYFAITPVKYSPSTSKLLGKVTRRLSALGYEPTDETQDVYVALPGRHGGWGIPWAPSSHVTQPFQVWKKETTK